MVEPSEELLDQPPKPSLLESLLLDSKNSSIRNTRAGECSAVDDEKGRKTITKVEKSQVLGKVKDFLDVMAKANKKLEVSAQGDSHANYDIEVLDGNEQEYIEMDLVLGVADLHTPEAVAAAEASMATFQSMPSESSSSSDSEDDDDDACPKKKPDTQKNVTSRKMNLKNPSKRPKIVELN